MGLVVPAIVAALWALRPAILAGDGPEYFLMLESWTRHASPDLRLPDTSAVRSLLAKNAGYDLVNADAGFMLSIDGKWFSYHFWMYPLLAAPFKGLIGILHGNEFESFRALNVFLFALAVAIALRYFPGSRFRRWTFVVFAAASPVLWYLAWPHSEVYSWSLVTMSVVAYARKRPAIASAAAATAALQNSPLVFLAFAYVLDPLVRRRWRSAAWALGGASIVGLSPVFYLLHYHHPSPFIACGQASAKYVSLARVASLLVDLNEGMLPYVPGLLALGVAAVMFAVVRRAWPAVIASLVLFAMILASSESVNWNHGCAGMLRYAVWMLPIFAGLAATYLPQTRRVKAIVIVAAIAQLATVWRGSGEDDSLAHTALSRTVLERAPALYNPDPEIFVERTLERSTEGSMDPLPLPVAFTRGRSATKVLTDNTHLPALQLEYEADPTYLASVRASHAAVDGMYYFEPPQGALMRRDVDPDVSLGPGVSFGAGWSPPESREGGRATRAMSEMADVRLQAVDADMVLTIVGSILAASSPTTMWVVLDDGTEVDRFVAPAPEVERTIPIARAHLQGDSITATLHVSRATEPSARFSLRRAAWELSPPVDPDAAAIQLGAGWYAPEGGGRWMGKRAELVLAPHAVPMKLRVRGWPPEHLLAAAPTFQITVDGKTLAKFVAFSRMEHEYVLAPCEGSPTHVIFETSATGTPPGDTRAFGYFFEILTWTHTTK